MDPGQESRVGRSRLTSRMGPPFGGLDTSRRGLSPTRLYAASMRSHDPENPVVYSGSIRWAITLRPLVVTLTGVVAAGLAVGITRVLEWGRSVFDVVALGWGIWGTLLALTIYLVSTANAKTAIDASQDEEDAEDATEGVVATVGSTMSGPALKTALSEHEDYVKALRRKYPDIPLKDIVYVDVAPRKGQERNRARIIATREGKEYSVFHGGRTGSWIIRRV